MPKKVCAAAGCRGITTKRFCLKCQAIADKQNKEQAKKRAKRSASQCDSKYQAFYKTPEWKSLRDRKFKQDSLCQDCKDNGFMREGHDVDHVIEIKDDWSRRLDITNLRTLCRACHVTKTIRVRKERQSTPILSRW